MSVAGYYRLIGGKISFTQEYQEILQEAIKEGFALPTIDIQVKQDKVIRDLIDEGIWDELDEFYFLFDSNINFSRINWIEPGRATLEMTGVGTGSGGANLSYSPDKGIRNTVSGSTNSSWLRSSRLRSKYTGNNASKIIYATIESGNPSIGYDNNGLTGTNSGFWTTNNTTAQRINQGTNNLNSSVDMTGNGYKAIMRAESNVVTLFNNETQFNRSANFITIENSTFSFFSSNSTVNSDLNVGMAAFGSNISTKWHDFTDIINEYLS